MIERTNPTSPPLRRRRFSVAAAISLALAMIVAVSGIMASSARAAADPVGLGTAGSYSVLAGATVTNTGPSVLTRLVGVSPGTALTGFPPGTSAGTSLADADAAQAQADLGSAFAAAAGQQSGASTGGDLVGQTLTTGVYTATSSLALSGTVTLDAQGDPTAVFVFQVASSLITSSGSRVALINGAQACRVFWQVGSSATLGTASRFAGTLMASASITATTGATIDGRLLARSGQVTLDANAVTGPSCDLTVPTTTTTTATATTSTSTTSTTTTTTTTTAPTSTSDPDASTTSVDGSTSTTSSGTTLDTTTDSSNTTSTLAGAAVVTTSPSAAGATTTTTAAPTTSGPAGNTASLVSTTAAAALASATPDPSGGAGASVLGADLPSTGGEVAPWLVVGATLLLLGVAGRFLARYRPS